MSKTSKQVWVGLEFVLAAALLTGLFLAIGIDANKLVEVLSHFIGWPLAAVFALTTIQVYLSACKWAFVLRGHGHHAPRPMPFYLFHTTTGALLGQLLPVQLSSVVTRAAALKVNNEHRPLVTGAYTSIFEQGFDFLFPLALLPTTFAAFSLGWTPAGWLVAVFAAVALSASASLWAASAIRGSQFIQSLFFRLCGALHMGDAAAPITRMLEPQTVRYMILFSAARYLCVLLRHAVVALACASLVKPWDVVMLAPALQFLALLSITPGGVGIIEWGWAGLLAAVADTPIASAALFALSLRLTFVASLLALAASTRIVVARTSA